MTAEPSHRDARSVEVRLLILIYVVALTAASCSSDEVADSTTSTVAPVTSTSSSHSSISPPLPPSTTSTLPTTTTTLLEGNWADAPIVAGGPFVGVLGWWDGAQWVQAEEGTALDVGGGEDYQVALLGSSTIIQGGPRVQGCDFVRDDYPAIEFSDPQALTELADSGIRTTISGVAISAPWELVPRPVTRGEAHPHLEALAVDLLGSMGFETNAVVIVQTVDADLDGDGAMQTIVVAEETELANSASGVYSIVFVAGVREIEPQIIDSSVIPRGEEGFPASFRVGAVADLNGDQVMEVVLSGEAWESSWVSVYEWTGAGLERRISAGCGV